MRAIAAQVSTDDTSAYRSVGDAESASKTLFYQPVLGGSRGSSAQDHAGDLRPSEELSHRGCGAHVLEFIGSDVDIVGEQFERSTSLFAQVACWDDVEAGESGSCEHPGIAARAAPPPLPAPAQLAAAENARWCPRLQLHLTSAAISDVRDPSRQPLTHFGISGALAK